MSLLTRNSYTLPAIFASFIFLSFHGYIILYINSTYLELFISKELVGILYSVGSLLNFLFLILAPNLIGKIGIYRLTIAALLLEAAAVILLPFAAGPLAAIIPFVIHQGTIHFVIYLFDIFLEGAQVDESRTGRIRGLYLTLSNIVLIISPVIAGFILQELFFGRVYFVSILFILPIFFFLMNKNIRALSKTIRIETSFLSAIKKLFIQDGILSKVVIARFLLQFFYAWMIIYTPIFLYSIIGFSWQEIGIMFSVMLLPFALLELPAGYLADTYLGEKEIMLFGFVIMSLATMLLSLFSAPIFILWTLALLLTRIGASLVEITTESYFYKNVTSANGDVISVFKSTTPAAFIISPIVGAVALLIVPFNFIFVVLGAITLTGIYFVASLKDTR